MLVGKWPDLDRRGVLLTIGLNYSQLTHGSDVVIKNNYQFFYICLPIIDKGKWVGAYTKCKKVIKPLIIGGGQDLFKHLFLRTCTIEKFISLIEV